MSSSSQTAVAERVPKARGVAHRANRPRLSPGSTLAAVEALTGAQETFSRAQVAYLLHLAYRSGAAAAHRDDVAELAVSWERNPTPAVAFEARVAQRLQDMSVGAQIESRRPKPRPLADLSDCDWPDVAVPGAAEGAA